MPTFKPLPVIHHGEMFWAIIDSLNSVSCRGWHVEFPLTGAETISVTRWDAGALEDFLIAGCREIAAQWDQPGAATIRRRRKADATFAAFLPYGLHRLLQQSINRCSTLREGEENPRLKDFFKADALRVLLEETTEPLEMQA